MPGKHIACAMGNFEPLAHTKLPVDKVALVTEGGGQRGIFTAGVLDAFLAQGYNPFSLMIGTSAGALNLASYICGQPNHAYRVITEATTAHDFFDWSRFLRGGEGLDLEWLVEQTQTQLPLNWEQGHYNMAQRKVLACASLLRTQEAGFFDLKNTAEWQLALKATCAIPFLHRHPIQKDGERWVDGGVIAPIPVEEAYRQGYRHIVVIRTVPSNEMTPHQWLVKLRTLLGHTKAAEAATILIEHERHYAETQAFLQHPPEGVYIYEIYPPTPLQSSLLGSRLPQLNTDYQLGLRSGRYFLSTLGRQFAHLNAQLPPPLITEFSESPEHELA